MTPTLLNELLGLLRCPEDRGVLEGWDGQATTGSLTCTACGPIFPVVHGLPRLIPDALRESAEFQDQIADAGEYGEKQREMAARDAQVTQYDNNIGLRFLTLPELPLTLHYLSPEPDMLMLEAGCGTGRMTPAFAARVRGLICADLSVESLKVARAKLPSELTGRVLFIQADLSHLPLESKVFDRVGSFGVLEHIPTPDARARALSEMARALKPRTHGGRIALSAYRWGAPISWSSSREGHHDGGIYFIRWTWDELSRLVSPHIDVHEHTGKLLYYFLLWGRRPQ